jgi:pimeloyl-ACP methyl ester carboxylesterase
VFGQAPIRHTAEVDGHPIAIWEKAGPNSKGVIVLVHGRTWSGLPDFDLQVPGEDLSLMDGLIDAGYATFAVDLRGYGGTPRDETGWLTPDRAARDLKAVLERVWDRTGRGDRPILFGWSYGSMLSQLTVQRWPELVSALVLFGHPGTNVRNLSAGEDPAEPPRVTNTAEAAASDFIIPGSISQAAIDRYVEVALEADPVRVDWGRLHEWSELDPAKVTVPTLLIQGEHDPIAPTEAQAPFFAGLGTGDREWVTVPGGDHAAFMETPRAYFLDAMVGFLERPR